MTELELLQGIKNTLILIFIVLSIVGGIYVGHKIGERGN